LETCLDFVREVKKKKKRRQTRIKLLQLEAANIDIGEYNHQTGNVGYVIVGRDSVHRVLTWKNQLIHELEHNYLHSILASN